jgi:hypothetical protein
MYRTNKIIIQKVDDTFEMTTECPHCHKTDTFKSAQVGTFLADIASYMEGVNSSTDLSADGSEIIIKVARKCVP